MEPTIYKPSIYKGPTIYKTGAEGGGGGGDIGTLQPILTNAGNGIDFQNEVFVIGNGLVRTPTILKQTDEIKFEIEFSFNSVNKFNSLFSPMVHWGNIDVHIEFNGTNLWIGIPNSSGNGWQGNWNGSLDYFDLSSIDKTIQSNTLYKLIIIVSCLNKTITLELDNVLIFNGTFSQVPKISDSLYNLFANFDDAYDYRSSGIIKYNSFKIYTDGTRVI